MGMKHEVRAIFKALVIYMQFTLTNRYLKPQLGRSKIDEIEKS